MEMEMEMGTAQVSLAQDSRSFGIIVRVDSRKRVGRMCILHIQVSRAGVVSNATYHRPVQ